MVKAQAKSKKPEKTEVKKTTKAAATGGHKIIRRSQRKAERARRLEHDIDAAKRDFRHDVNLTEREFKRAAAQTEQELKAETEQLARNAGRLGAELSQDARHAGTVIGNQVVSDTRALRGKFRNRNRAEQNILIVFVTNLFFSLLELVGGLLTNSFAILADALHDFCDALTIGVAFRMERKSHQKADARHTYGYGRLSTLGALLTTVILLVGAGVIIAGSAFRLCNPADVSYDGMIWLAVLGVLLNGAVMYYTRAKRGDENQQAANLQMTEDVLGWGVILIGAILIKVTGWTAIDPLMSMGVAIFILLRAWKNLRPIADVFLERAPEHPSMSEVAATVVALPEVASVHHIHLWYADEESIFATMHVVTVGRVEAQHMKTLIRGQLTKLGIKHVVIELESAGEKCRDQGEIRKF